jgi:hypothetical protein
VSSYFVEARAKARDNILACYTGLLTKLSNSKVPYLLPSAYDPSIMDVVDCTDVTGWDKGLTTMAASFVAKIPEYLWAYPDKIEITTKLNITGPDRCEGVDRSDTRTIGYY